MIPDVKLPQDSPNNQAVCVVSPVADQQDFQPDPGSEPNLWHKMLPELALGGMALQLADHCSLKAIGDTQVVLLLDANGSNLQTSRTEEQLTEALCTYLGKPVRVVLEVVTMQGEETPERRRLRVARELQQQAEQAIEQDPFVRQLRERFGAMVVQGSIRPHTDG